MNTPSLQYGFLILLISTFSGHSYAADSEDSPSVIRSYTFDTTMDKAGDATRQAEVALENSMGALEACKGITDSSDAVAIESCEAAKAERQKFLEETKGIRNTQRMFAHASRASDVAAVGAIGVVGYQELMKKDATQADNLRSVAKVQETAGYVSYTAGAADFAMGAYSFAAHKSRLEKMKELISKSKTSSLTAEEQEVVSRMTAAAEASKKAAYNHMLYGAGKAAVGYGSMHLAKQNKKIADSLTSLEIPAQYGVVNGATVSNRNPNAPFMMHNRPEFFIPNKSNSSSLQGNPYGESGGSPIVGGGASVMPNEGTRTPSSGGGLGGGSPSVSTGGGKSGDGSTAAPASAPEETAAAAGAKDPFGNSFELNLMGGGGMGYRGGESVSGSAEAPALDAVTGAPTSNATGLNPGQIYSEATEDLSGEELGSMAGISNGNSSLFEVVRAKYVKMAEGGRVQGPGAVEVKN